jgi:hypothetical protein
MALLVLHEIERGQRVTMTSKRARFSSEYVKGWPGSVSTRADLWNVASYAILGWKLTGPRLP